MNESIYLVAATRPWNREVLMLLAERYLEAPPIQDLVAGSRTRKWRLPSQTTKGRSESDPRARSWRWTRARSTKENRWRVGIA